MVYIFEIIVASYSVFVLLAGFLGDLPDLTE